MAGRATIVEVAQRLGVAPSTVSRAFNEPHRLLPETVERVLRVADEMGYMPNRYARALSTGRSGAIGLVVPDITNPFFPRMIRSAQSEAELHDLSVYVAETTGDPRRELRLVDRLLPQVEGLVLASPRLADRHLLQVVRRGRVVVVNRDTPGTARVLIASGEAVSAAVEHLVAAGHTRLCYVGGPSLSWSESERRSAVEATAAGHEGVEVTAMRAEQGTYQEARDLAPAIAASRATAVVAFDDIVAHGVMNGLSTLGITVPADVRLVGCDDALPIETRPRLSTIRLRTDDGIRRAVQMLRADTATDVGEARVALQGTLHLRETT